MSDRRTDSTTQRNKVEDIAMIDSRVKDLANQIFEEKQDEYQDINELVEEVFARGLMEVLASNQGHEEVEEDFLVDDDFEYASWQLNLCHRMDEMDTEWIDIKSTILRQGLKEVSGEVKVKTQ